MLRILQPAKTHYGCLRVLLGVFIGLSIFKIDSVMMIPKICICIVDHVANLLRVKEIEQTSINGAAVAIPSFPNTWLRLDSDASGM